MWCHKVSVVNWKWIYTICRVLDTFLKVNICMLLIIKGSFSHLIPLVYFSNISKKIEIIALSRRLSRHQLGWWKRRNKTFFKFLKTTFKCKQNLSLFDDKTVSNYFARQKINEQQNCWLEKKVLVRKMKVFQLILLDF